MISLQKFARLNFIIVVGSLLAACGSADRSGDIEPVQVLPAATAATSPETASSETGPATADPTTAPPSTTTAPTTPSTVIEFEISGGIAAFCDSLVVDTQGNYAVQSCERDEITGTLAQADLEVLQNWDINFGVFETTFEDNPGGSDNMTTRLNFAGHGNAQPDEAQEQMIFDWVNGLFIRLWPQAVEAPPTPTPTEIGAGGLCPDVSRPAMIIADFNNPGNLTIVDPDTLVECNVTLAHPPSGRVLAAAGSIYYPVFDESAETMTLWQLSATGEQTSLPFTTVTMEGVGPFTFAVADDASRIALARAFIDPNVEPPLYRNDLWVAHIDGSNQATILDQVENSQKQLALPIRFAPDGSELFYAMQPDVAGGGFGGRFGSVYAVSASGGESELIFACPTAENPICIGDITADGSTLAYTAPDTGQVRLISRQGNQLTALTAPATDYVGSAVFGPTGNLAFVSATFTQANEEAPPLPDPGYITFLAAPYTGEAQILLSNNTIVTLWEWLDEARLAYGSLDEVGNLGTSIVTLEGQVTDVSPNYALAVLR